jgi:hypothetical protein
MFGKKDENVRRENRNASLTPGLNYPSTGRSQPETSTPNPPPPEPAKPAAKADDTKGSKLIEGELTARKQLVIHSTGRVSGKIRYGKITVEDGGQLSGDVDAISVSAIDNISKGADLKPAPADVMTSYDPFARKAKSFYPAGP